LQRKATSDKKTLRPKNSQKTSEFDATLMDNELDDVHLNTDPVVQKPKRPKRIKKNVNEMYEDTFPRTATTVAPEQTQFQPPHDEGSKIVSGQDT
jgi:DNA helicase INO80